MDEVSAIVGHGQGVGERHAARLEAERLLIVPETRPDEGGGDESIRSGGSGGGGGAAGGARPLFWTG